MMIAYYWATFCVTFACIYKLPSPRMNGTMDNIIGTVLVSMFGFIIWPLAVYAKLKSRTPHEQTQ